MKIRKIFPGIGGLFIFTGLVLLPVVIANHPANLWAAQDLFLGDKHKSTGMNCDKCHKENPPAKPVPMAVCFECHGDYAKLVEQTKEVKPHNPHESHLGDLECEACHHMHKPSVNYCASCHNFGFKVP